MHMTTKHGYHNANGHQTWLPQRIWPPNIATTTQMATRHGYHNAYGHQTCLGDDLPWHIYGHQTWLGDDLPQHIYGHQTWLGGDLPQCIWPPTMAGWWFTTPHMATKYSWVMITTTHMATKHGWVIIYHDRIPTIMTMWLSETKWQTKIITSPLPKCLRPPNLAVWWLILRNFCPFSHITLSLHGLARSRENLISLLPQ